jgi:peptidoglycan hydrolase-like protein with peptidoglycan-binding domain
VVEQKLSTTVRARGTGGFGSPRPVTLPASGLSAGSVITSLPAPNDVVQEGGVLATVSGRPVLALPGEAPMYRDLGPGMSGADVSQLEVALQRIGLNPGNVDGFYDAGTEAAVRALFTNAGFQPVLASTAQLEAAGLSPCPGAPGSCPGAGVVVPANELFFVAGTPVQVGDVPATVGSDASGPLMTVSDSTPKVAGSLRVAESKLVKAGMKVKIDEPDLGIKAKGKVTSVAERPGTNGLDQFHVYFETSVDKAPDRLNGVSVRVVIPVKTTKNAELTVPLSAVVLDANGSSRVQVVTKDGLQNVEVRPGLSADGYVVVKPTKKDTLKPGDKVVVGYRAPRG